MWGQGVGGTAVVIGESDHEHLHTHLATPPLSPSISLFGTRKPQIEKQYADVGGRDAEPLRVGAVAPDRYVRQLEWDFAKYAVRQPLPILVGTIQTVSVLVGLIGWCSISISCCYLVDPRCTAMCAGLSGTSQVRSPPPAPHPGWHHSDAKSFLLSTETDLTSLFIHSRAKVSLCQVCRAPLPAHTGWRHSDGEFLFFPSLWQTIMFLLLFCVL
jgi:hypothetical protein